MNRNIALLALGLCLAAGSVRSAPYEACAQGRAKEAGKELIFPFFAMGFESGFPNVVTIHFDPSFRETSDAAGLVRDAVGKWEAVCLSSLPISFRVNPVDPRPPVTGILDEDYRSSIAIIVDKDREFAINNNGMVLGGWSEGLNEIVLPGRCPRTGTHGLPCAGPGFPIDWGRDRRWTTQILAHELGHAMGLKHDGEGGTCLETIMKKVLEPGVTYRVEPRHCSLIRLLNNHDDDCNHSTPVVGQPHPCDQKLRQQSYFHGRPGGPGGVPRGSGDFYCDSFPGLCHGSDHLAWRGGGISCEWNCVTWQGQYGDRGGTCGWSCRAAPLFTEAGEKTGAGPLLALLNLRPGDDLAGRPLLRGFAMDFIGVALIDFFWNGQRIQPRSLATRLYSPEACTPPLGLYHAHCVRESGFEARIDTTLLPNGPGTLALVATDVSGWTSNLELNLTIANDACGDPAPPEVEILRPAANAAVGGAVRVEVEAEDDFAVRSVELWASGQRVGQTTQYPYVFEWNTSALPLGTRRLVARATDGCGNTGSSAEVEVLVDNRQAPYSGAPVVLPNRIEAENYDLGLPGVAYFDSTPGNAGQAYRQDDVDVGTDSGQFVVGYVAAGEWLEYTVEVPVAERYRIWLRSSSPSGGQVALAVDGNESPAFALPPTGSFTRFLNTAAPEALTLAAGRHVLRLRAVTAGFNLDWLELEPLPGACPGSAVAACLQGQRFMVSASVDGQPARVAASLGDTSFFTVFDPQNVELAIKVLDARPINGRFWVYHGSLTTLPYTVTVTDTQTGRSRNYFKLDSSLCGGGDIGSFPFAGGGESVLATCGDSANAVCLLGDRYRVEVTRGGFPAGANRITGQTGSFTFFSPNNHEVVVKILDGSSWNGHRWVFFGSLTDQAYEVRVTDTLAGKVVNYGSPGAFCGRHDFDDF